MKISVGNLPQNLNEEDLGKLFSQFGTVESVHIKRDKKTNTSLGYGSVEMPEANAKDAIERLNGHEIDSKKIVVVDSITLQAAHEEKHGKNSTDTGSKIHGARGGSNFSGSTVRKSGGGGRGK
jgi:RNA recognition motif-containing protein